MGSSTSAAHGAKAPLSATSSADHRLPPAPHAAAAAGTRSRGLFEGLLADRQPLIYDDASVAAAAAFYGAGSPPSTAATKGMVVLGQNAYHFEDGDNRQVGGNLPIPFFCVCVSDKGIHVLFAKKGGDLPLSSPLPFTRAPFPRGGKPRPIN